MTRWSWALYGVMLASFSHGQTLKLGVPERSGRTGERVTTGRVAQLGPGGQIIGPWREFQGSVGSPRNAWSPAFDTMSYDLASDTPFSGIYGQTFGFFRFANDYRNPYVVLDIQRLAPNANGRHATRVVTDLVWNPGGGFNTSGSGRLAIAIMAATSFGGNAAAVNFTGGLGGTLPGSAFSGIVLDFGVQSHGWRTFDANLTGTGFGIPLPLTVSPTNPGALVMVIGTINANGAFVLPPAGWAAQFTMDTMASPADPTFPGWNPSQSGPLQWDDDGGQFLGAISNGIHDNWTSTNNAFSELYSYDWSMSNRGWPQSAVALFFPQTGGRWAGNAQQTPPQPTVDLTLIAVDDNGVPVPAVGGGLAKRSWTLATLPNGDFEFPDPQLEFVTNQPESQNVLAVFGGGVKLRKVIGPFNLSTITRLPDVSLQIGDVNMDGVIDGNDLNQILSRFGTQYGNPEFIDTADLTSDGLIDGNDVNAVLLNFGAEGEPMPTVP